MPTVWLNGRLGNHLFMIATCYAHALTHGNGKFCIRGQLHSYLQHLLSNVSDKSDEQEHIWGEPHYHYEPIPAEATVLRGYFQSGKYFSHCASQVRQLLAPRPEMLTTINQRYASLLTPHMRKSAVVVHVRRGDYQNPRHKKNYGFLDYNYFWNAIRRMHEVNPGGLMLIFSDDIEWCEAQPIFKGALFIREADDSLALTLMCQFKHFILSNSSFSWWGAWLAGDNTCVLAPERWYDHSYISDYQDVYEPTWELIPVESS